ncbi:hypothetical protein DIPPA_24060 [Diplonema papillatum]|nr:hypothetical protein DIPPA_24060 [Diplonema papillatum]
MVEAPTTNQGLMRAFMNLGGADNPVLPENQGFGGFWFGSKYRDNRLIASFAGDTGIIIDSDWHQYAATYDGSTVRVYFDEREVATVDVALDLVESTRYSTMMIGETHFGKTNVARGCSMRLCLEEGSSASTC